MIDDWGMIWDWADARMNNNKWFRSCSQRPDVDEGSIGRSTKGPWFAQEEGGRAADAFPSDPGQDYRGER